MTSDARTSDIDIAYRPRGRIGGLRVGAHASRVVGAFGAFRDEVPFMAHPTPASTSAPACATRSRRSMRRFHQRAAIDVVALSISPARSPTRAGAQARSRRELLRHAGALGDARR
jgi:hypothetical protein